MPHRVLAIFLAVLTFWSALATQELPFLDSADHAALVAMPVQGGPSSGSLEAHHLDDQPSQSAVEHASDPPAWLPAPDAPVVALSARMSLCTPAVFTPSGTVPGVLQRPPCA